ncbi:MAG: hypothetical protein D6687_05060 [Acidobacteria bacterium]|jgi:hypothetical protein|nr:MAG: hypothetical protein D6687_05060 [Acidobacteriota bacterium]GIU82837.1 MAG: hypothetical protein KatS3mg006_1901 [Pyrinomonadaceae bacterium]
MAKNEKFFNKYEKNFKDLKEGIVFSWSEVSKIHRTRNGIYQKDGRLISLLTDFGKINRCYPDVYEEGKILYTGAGRRGNQKLDIFNQALLNAIESRHAVPLFCKLSVGRWKFLGFWKVVKADYVFDERQKRMVWKFLLEKAELC